MEEIDSVTFKKCCQRKARISGYYTRLDTLVSSSKTSNKTMLTDIEQR